MMTRTLVFAISVCALVGCRDANLEPEWAGASVLAEGFATELDFASVSSTPPVDVPPLTPEVERTMEEMDARYAQILAEPAPPEIYDQLESIYLTSGRAFILADYYLEVVESHGPDSHLRPRLAWYYEQVGQHTSARRQADIALENRPNDPNVHFIRGFLLLEDAESDPAVFEEVQQHFARVLELDPAFLGPYGVSAQALAAEVERLSRQ